MVFGAEFRDVLAVDVRYHAEHDAGRPLMREFVRCKVEFVVGVDAGLGRVAERAAYTQSLAEAHHDLY